MWSNQARLQKSCDKTGVKLQNTNIKCFPKAYLSFQLVHIILLLSQAFIRLVIVVLMRKKRLKRVKNSEVKGQSPDNASGKNDQSTRFHFAVKWMKRGFLPLFRSQFHILPQQINMHINLLPLHPSTKRSASLFALMVSVCDVGRTSSKLIPILLRCCCLCLHSGPEASLKFYPIQ